MQSNATRRDLALAAASINNDSVTGPCYIPLLLTFFALFYNSIQLRLPFFGKTFFFPLVSNDIYIWLLFSDFFLLQNFLALKCLFLYLIQQQGGGRRAGGGFFFEIHVQNLFSEFFSQNFLALKCLFLYLIQQQGGGRRAGGGFFFEIHVQNLFSEFFSQNFLALKCLFLYLIQQQGGRRAGGGLPGKLGDHWIRRSLLHWDREREIITKY